MSAVKELARRAKEAARRLAALSTDEKNALLLAMAEELTARKKEILEANRKDVEAGQAAGLTGALLDRLEWQARQRGLATIWLEVRASNARARYLYGARGFVEQGIRRGYYPAGASRREDAVVMKLDVDREATHAAG